MKRKEWYQRLKRIILELQFLGEKELVCANWDEMEMVRKDREKLKKILEQLEEIV